MVMCTKGSQPHSFWGSYDYMSSIFYFFRHILYSHCSDLIYVLNVFLSIGLAVLKHTLTPRMKASHLALEAMAGHLDAVYDITVAYEGTQGGSRQRKPAPSMPGKQATDHLTSETVHSVINFSCFLNVIFTWISCLQSFVLGYTYTGHMQMV